MASMRASRWRVDGNYLTGITFGQWCKLLWTNRLHVEPAYVPRALSITLMSLHQSMMAWVEGVRFGRRITSVQEIPPPLFILGHWRSGTTHLFQLLAQDPQFASPTLYQVMSPRSFLITERYGKRLFAAFVPARRPMDEVTLDFDLPEEDEFALALTTLCSPYLGRSFPRNESYERYLTLRDVSEREREAWKSALIHFVKKLTCAYNRPLILKSPGHTARIRLLLELFPAARFVHIHRDPYVVFQSMRWMEKTLNPFWRLQSPVDGADERDERILRTYATLYDAFLQQRPLIPKGRFHQMRFEDLEADPIGQLRILYTELGLGDFFAVEQRLRRYRQTLSGYRKNTYPPLPEALRRRIAERWQRYFEAWRYDPG